MKSVHVIPRTEVAEYRHLRKVQYLKDNVLSSIIPPPPEKKQQKTPKKKTTTEPSYNPHVGRGKVLQMCIQ